MSRVLGIGEKFPEFSMEACVSLDKGKEFKTISNKDMKGKWNVVFFWPLDFTFVCPTEISDFNKEIKSFRDLETQVFGVSCDSKFVHLAWRKDHPDLKNLEFPMLADNKKDLSDSLGVLHPIDK